MKTIAAAVLLLGSLLLVQGCGGAGGSSGDAGIAIRGEVIAVGELPNGPGTLMLVEGKKEEDTRYDKANVSVPQKTANVYKMANGKKEKAAVSDLKSGLRVEVRFAGPAQEMGIVQGEAKEVVILEGGSGTGSQG
ncbi:hypothetical protein [Paenibacillus sp. GYB003]|uniref:hypothetical protein n=1 Tax=Paenibacillus sp. GYB003 TaxID=2994392 RepID=UPI002F96BB1B